MIARYLAELEGALRFDPGLARRVAREVEDHLHEAVAAHASVDRAEAERHAVASFGDPHALAMQFACLSLARRTRRASVAVVLAIVAVLLAMKARLAWYAAANWRLSEETRELAGTVLAIDRFAFWLSVIAGLIALFRFAYLRIPEAPQPGYYRQSRRVVVLCAVAALSLVVSVVSDGVLTALQLTGEWREGALIPLASMAVEIVCVAAVAFLIVDAIRRGGHIHALLRA